MLLVLVRHLRDLILEATPVWTWQGRGLRWWLELERMHIRPARFGIIWTFVLTNRPRFKRFGDAREDAALKSIAGAMFEVEIDSTHPLAYGFSRESVAVFRRGTYHYQRPVNSYQTAGIYGDVIAGYVNDENEKELQGTAAVFVVPVGKGRVIVLADNPVFRGYIRGTEPFFTNALYLGPSIRLPTSSSDEHDH